MPEHSIYKVVHQNQSNNINAYKMSKKYSEVSLKQDQQRIDAKLKPDASPKMKIKK